MTKNFTEENLTEAVIERMAACPDERLKTIMTSLIRHVHAFVREVELTEEEWFRGIKFLTDTGHKCDDVRQEFILLSDVLGVSMLVDAVNHRYPAGATETTVFGPFYRENAPETQMWGDISPDLPGTPAYVSGTVKDTAGKPIANALIDVWQSDGVNGLYDVQVEGQPWYGRGRVRTDEQGRYAFRTVQPVYYSIPDDGPVGDMLHKLERHTWRPAHIHTMVQCEGYHSVTTHLFVNGDQYLDSDAVFGVKDSLIVDFTPHPAGETPDGKTSDKPYTIVNYDFVLTKG
ncbi:MAG: intradiol ring-cleavage dioxygenase [Burkholderiaceae bacterium]